MIEEHRGDERRSSRDGRKTARRDGNTLDGEGAEQVQGKVSRERIPEDGGNIIEARRRIRNNMKVQLCKGNMKVAGRGMNMCNSIEGRRRIRKKKKVQYCQGYERRRKKSMASKDGRKELTRRIK